MIELFFVLCFGLCFGSFANVIILRIPKNLSIIAPKSFCFTCKTSLKWCDKIPLLSVILHRGKCPYCKIKISPLYYCSEIFGAICALFCYIFFIDSLILALFLFFFLLNFYALSSIDYQFLAIPDCLNYLGFFLGIFCGSLLFSPLFALLNAFLFLGFASFLRLFLGSYCKKEVLGEGDLIVFGSMGAVLGFYFGAIAIFLSAVFALVFLLIKWKKHLVTPFVPFLFLGFIATLLLQHFSILEPLSLLDTF